MFFELEKKEYEIATALYGKTEIVFPLILAVLQKKQRGWVFVNDPKYPTSALVITNFGFMQFIGDNGAGENLVKFLMSPQPNIPTYLLWYSPPPQVSKTLDSIFPQQIRRRERIRFAFDQPSNENNIEYPTGFEVRPIDKSLLQRAGHFRLDIESRFWTSADDFLKNGIGICVLKEKEVISLCYSACVVSSLAEIDIATQAEYRGMGLAVIAAQNFIRECLQRNITPTWDCFTSNTASLHLAKKLGFNEQQKYYLYSFNIHIPPPTVITKELQK